MTRDDRLPSDTLMELTGCELAQWIEQASPRTPALGWLGQAGFLVRLGEHTLAIDPYLSDSLADKYRGEEWSHQRMMPVAVDPARLRNLRAVLCTHAHGDHMDPGTLPILAQVNPDCQFVVPRAAQEIALARGVPRDRLVAVNSGDEVRLADSVSIRVLPAAHEELRWDEAGNHHYLGYVLRGVGAAIYHSGDCVPFPALAGLLAAESISVALLPVNGRDATRRDRGVPGNFTFAEAVELCRQSSIPWLVACHFGMFAFNTVDPGWLDEQIAGVTSEVRCLRPRLGRVYWLSAACPDDVSTSVPRRIMP